MESLTYVARHLDDQEQRHELLLKTLQLFIQQGIGAKRASDSAQSSHKVREGGGREGGPEGGRDGGREGGREGGIEMEGEREGGKEGRGGGRERCAHNSPATCLFFPQATSSSFSLGLLLPVISTVRAVWQYGSMAVWQCVQHWLSAACCASIQYTCRHVNIHVHV